MKKVIEKLIGWLNVVPKDKYQHFTLGAIIASLALIITAPLIGCWRWMPLAISVVALVSLAMVKEYAVDSKVDMNDILWTIGGGYTVWVIFIVFING